MQDYIHIPLINSVYSFDKKEVEKYQACSNMGKAREEIKSVLSEVGYNITFKTNYNLGKHIKNKKLTNIHKHYKSSVNKLKCCSCYKFYKTKTSRSFKLVHWKHFKSFINNKTEYYYANHLNLIKHNFDTIFDISH